MAQYLFVITRSLETDVTARFVLRSALVLCRRNHEVTVFLADDAMTALNPACTALLEPLICANNARVMAGTGAQRGRRTLPGCGIRAATDDDLADLLLTPGMQAQWC